LILGETIKEKEFNEKEKNRNLVEKTDVKKKVLVRKIGEKEISEKMALETKILQKNELDDKIQKKEDILEEFSKELKEDLKKRFLEYVGLPMNVKCLEHGDLKTALQSMLEDVIDEMEWDFEEVSCDICGFQYNSRGRLRCHMNLSHEEKEIIPYLQPVPVPAIPLAVPLIRDPILSNEPDPTYLPIPSLTRVQSIIGLLRPHFPSLLPPPLPTPEWRSVGPGAWWPSQDESPTPGKAASLPGVVVSDVEVPVADDGTGECVLPRDGADACVPVGDGADVRVPAKDGANAHVPVGVPMFLEEENRRHVPPLRDKVEISPVMFGDLQEMKEESRRAVPPLQDKCGLSVLEEMFWEKVPPLRQMCTGRHCSRWWRN
jgi:hypothetical protein